MSFERQTVATPFALQLEEIDRALFDYRYKKQSMHSKYGNSAGSSSNNSSSRMYNNNSMNNNRGFNRNKYHSYQQQPHQQQQQQQQPSIVTGQQIPQISQISQGLSRFQPLPSSPATSFVENLVSVDPFPQYKKLSSPINSDSSSSNSSISFNSADLFTPLGMNTSVPASGAVPLAGSMGSIPVVGASTIPVANNNNVIPGTKESKFNDFGFSQQQQQQQNNQMPAGWLNIWGNDMSVWG